MTKQRTKHIGLRFLLAWFFGVSSIILGVGSLVRGIGGIPWILGGVILLPPFGEFIEKKYNYHLSGWLKLIIFLSFVVLGTTIMSNETVTLESVSGVSPQDNKVKSGTIIIDKVTVTLANLYPIRVTITNTGDVSFTPKFDVYAIDDSGATVCEGSPLFSGVNSIKSKEKITEEIQILGCIFNKDGDYTIKVDMLDENYNKLSSSQKVVTVNYWGQFSFN